MFLLVDCNNFFASCERVFNPGLRDKPVIVLSNNDGCVVARSNEAKRLGFKMGDAYFKRKDFIKKHGVVVFSSNYALYGDMSGRVMRTLAGFVKDMEVYSVDEAFLDMGGFGAFHDLTEYSRGIMQTVQRNTGIPVSGGIAGTKTLAKVASKFAKKYRGYRGVCLLDNEVKIEKALKLFEVGDVWGIGRRYEGKLQRYGIQTAWDFVQKPEKWVRAQMGVVGVRTWKELQGVPCFGLEMPGDKKSICTSRSFPVEIMDFETLFEAVANFAASCARKLREQGSCAGVVTVFIHTNFFRDDLPSLYQSCSFELPVASNASSELIMAAKVALKGIYQKGYAFKKAGVIVSELVKENEVQGNLFYRVDRERQRRLYQVLDMVNRRIAPDTLKLAVQGNRKGWELRREFMSKRFTTSWNDLIEIH